MSEKVEFATILALKIDKFQTKLFLFDIVGEKYRLIASAESETTAFHPFNDIREGVFRAIDRIQNITGRILINDASSLIIPSRPDGNGIDCLAFTYGFINFMSTITMGLLESVSIESLNRLVSMTQLKLLDQISNTDPRKVEEILTLLTSLLPNLIIIAGGTDQGASNSILKQMDMLRFIIRNIPPEKRPEILFVGNNQVQQDIVNNNKENLNISFAANIRPSIDYENLTPALNKIRQISDEYMKNKIGGFHDLASNCISPPIPFSQAASFMTRFLSRLNNQQDTSVLYLELNREGTYLAAATNGKPALEVTDISLNSNIQQILTENSIKEIIKWSNIVTDDEVIKIYLWDKTIHPNAIPDSESQLEIEMSLARLIINNQVKKIIRNWPDLPQNFNQIIVSSDFFSNYLNPADGLFVLLNSIQPIGMTKFYLDRNGIIPVLGSIATFNKFLPVQLIDSTAISLLAQVISIKSNAKFGIPILKILIEYDDGKINEIIVSKGSIVSIPLNPGQKAKAKITPLKRVEIELSDREIENDIILLGGLCGVVVDARGRPILLPKNESQRIDLLQQWRTNMKI
jgi:hypothetical protein